MGLSFDSKTDIHVVACADGESIDVARQIPRSVSCSVLAKQGTKSFWTGRALVIHRKYLLSLPAASLLTLLLSLILRVRFVGGNLIALKQFEKMIQSMDSKHLITAWMDSLRWAQLMLNAIQQQGKAIVSLTHTRTPLLHTPTHIHTHTHTHLDFYPY